MNESLGFYRSTYYNTPMANKSNSNEKTLIIGTNTNKVEQGDHPAELPLPTIDYTTNESIEVL